MFSAILTTPDGHTAGRFRRVVPPKKLPAFR